MVACAFVRRLARPLLCAMLAAVPPVAAAAPPTGVTLVLSGGGARGAAHVGVLKVLEEMHVPVDRVVGTSIGSIIGGLYATGWTPQEIQDLLAGFDFSDVFVDHPVRADKTFRRKQDDAEFLIPLRLRLRGWKPYLPPALSGGQRLELLLRTLEIESTTERDFDRFPIPYRAVAADLATGEAVVLGDGSLATAMRASMAVAGMFSPVEVEGRRLVDGGAAANLPVRIARDLGAGAIVAVDITSPLLEEEEIGSVFSVINQMSSILTVENRAEDLRALRDGDVLIRPDLGDIGFPDFDRAVQAAALGEAAARRAAEGLRAFATGDGEYAAFQARRRRHPPGAIPVREVRLRNDSWVDDRVVRRRLHLPVGKPLDTPSLRTDILRLHALDYFGTIRQSFEPAGEGGVLTLETPRKPYGRNSLQFGVNFRDDFQGDAGYALAIRHQKLAATRRGGEWQNIGQIGETSLFSTEFYQPIDFGMTWFVAPGGEARRDTRYLWEDGRPVTEYRTGKSEARLEAGRVLGSWGEIRAGAFYSSNTGVVRMGEPLIEDFSEKDGGLRVGFRVDTLDDTVFPESGLRIETVYSHSIEAFGAETEYRTAFLSGRGARTFGRNTIVPGVEFGSVLEGPTTLGNVFGLGGLLRLSGLGTNELLGRRYGLATMVYFRELANFDLGSLSPEVYGGLSIEAGNTYLEGDPVSWDTLRQGGGVFVGAKTPLGPVYLAYGLAEGGRRRLYLNIGARF